MPDEMLHPKLNGVVTHPVPAASGQDSLRTFAPLDPTSFAVHLQVFIGTEGDDLSDSFDVLLCTPAWLVEHFESPAVGLRLASGRILAGRGLWIVERWDPGAVETALQELMDSTTAPVWPDLANSLGRIVPWEYEYRYDSEHGLTNHPPGKDSG